MDDQEMIAKLLDGYSLRTRMVPDPSIPSNFPEHVETYDLPHVIINDAFFWAQTETSHLVIHDDQPNSFNNAFCYTNSANVFVSFVPDQEFATYVMDRGRYKKHDWVLKKNYRLVWDSDKNQPADMVGREIDAAAKLKIAMLDSEDIWNIHPVELPMYYPDQETFSLKTVNDQYVRAFRDPEGFLRELESSSFMTRDCKDPAINMVQVTLPGFYTYYELSSDGTYRNFYDIPRGTRQPYKALRVFSDNL